MIPDVATLVRTLGWRPRSETPPAGPLWASDGAAMWPFLIGNEPVQACVERIHEVIAWGGEPHVQPFMKLNALEKRPHIRFDWTAHELRKVQRWANRHLWKYTPLAGYDASARTVPEPNPGQGSML